MARFRTRARAVEMLGRQQIAGIPTAISELFKNAHDAYADHAEVDFFRRSGLFLLRDDGVGMSRQDFEARWLTLGTESKLGLAGGIAPPPKDPTKAERPVLGEKGIGRLAIGAIGPQVLVLTRPKSSNSVGELTASFINWGMFSLPGIDIEDIEIPIREFPGGALPSAQEIAALVDSAMANLNALASRTDKAAAQWFAEQLRSFRVDPQQIAEEIGGLTLSGGRHGTHFYILPTDESLVASIDSAGDEDTAAPLLKMLIGFTNTMTPSHLSPRIVTAFRDHRSDGVVDDLIAAGEFFTLSEFENADHHIQGEFDDYGQFKGTVTVYGEPSVGHVVPWPSRGRRTECGPFSIAVAVVQGMARESTVPTEDWARIIRKMNRLGGLYIYKDGIRVLPYGNNDYDFLDIERRRTYSASYYYFSYRRIFGAIEITAAQNPALSEKAGREGFRENAAYRQFRDILKNFFVQIAADFFRPRGVESSVFQQRRAELDRIERAKRSRGKASAARRTALQGRIERAFSDIEAGRPTREVAAVLGDFDRRVEAALAPNGGAEAVATLVKAESAARGALAELLDKYRIAAPRGVGLTRSLRRDLDSYRVQFSRLETDLFMPAMSHVEDAIRRADDLTDISVGRRLRFDNALSDLADRTRRGVLSEARSAEAIAKDLQSRAFELTKQTVSDLERSISEVLSRAARTDVTKISDAEFVEARTRLERELEERASSYQHVLSSVATQLRGLRWEPDETGELLTDFDATEALEEEVLALREQAEVDIELAQLGMAIQVINHEFTETIRSVRRGLRELSAWADANEELRDLYERLRASFEHLDGYLTLFTPLQRRLYRKPVRMTGGEIHKFLTDLFRERLSTDHISLEATSAFRRRAIVGYPSTFYPVFVNLIDNAIYWVGLSPEPREIRLRTDGDAFVVEDSGPGVPDRDREAVFELGFTRKPGGRGLGLFISRDVLKKEGYSLTIQDSDRGASFRIEPVTRMENEKPAE